LSLLKACSRRRIEPRRLERRRLIVESPTTIGLIVARAFSPEPSLLPTVTATLAAAQCKPQ
jgi:uncharacterized membrane protein